MATLISAHNSEGCIGRCDAKCHEATSDTCNCICGGMNHGAGLDKAMKNTQEYAELWMDEYRQKHPDVIAFDVPAPKPIQLPLFDLRDIS